MKRLESHIFSSAGRLASASAFSGAVGIVAVPITLGALGLRGYGVIGWYSTIVISLSLLDGGVAKFLKRAVIRAESTQDEQGISTIAGTYLWVLLGLSVLCALVAMGLFSSAWGNGPDASGRGALVSALLILGFVEYASGVPILIGQARLLALDRFREASILTALGGGGRTALICIAAVLWQDPIIALGAALARRGFEVLYLRVIFARSWLPPMRFVRFSEAATVIRQSVGLGAVQLLQAAASPVALLCAQWTVGLEAVGLLRATLDVVGRIALLPNAVAVSVFARLAQMAHRDRGGAERELLRLAVLVLTGISALVLTAHVGLWLSGSAAAGAVLTPLVYGAIVMLAAGAAAVLSEGLIAMGRVGASLSGSALSLVLLVVMLLTLEITDSIVVLKYWAVANVLGVVATAAVAWVTAPDRVRGASSHRLVALAFTTLGLCLTVSLQSQDAGPSYQRICGNIAVIGMMTTIWAMTARHAAGCRP